MEEEVKAALEMPNHQDLLPAENHADQVVENNENQAIEDDPKWWDSESQYLLDSQQLVEGLSLCDELLRIQSPNRDGYETDKELKAKPRLADYAHLGPENLKKDLEACQALVFDPTNLELDTPPDFRLSQIVNSVILSGIFFHCIEHNGLYFIAIDFN